jgi:predicted nucleotidyltransferase
MALGSLFSRFSDLRRRSSVVVGSVARSQDRPDSDLDLLADLPPDMVLFGLGRVQADLEAIIGSKVDLVPVGDLKPGVRARASRDLVPL